MWNVKNGRFRNISREAENEELILLFYKTEDSKEQWKRTGVERWRGDGWWYDRREGQHQSSVVTKKIQVCLILEL